MDDYSRWEYESALKLIENYPRFFNEMGGKRVLDIGCGMGGKTVAYSEAGASVTGVDIEVDSVMQSAMFSRNRGVAIDFLAGDAEHIPFEPESFDLVIANDSMEHFPDPARALKELVFVVKPGGMIFLFFTPWRSPLGSHLYDYIHTPWCHLIYSEKLLRELLILHFRKRGSAEPESDASRIMGQYRRELNRITVRRYREILASMNGIKIVEEEFKPPKFSILSLLTKLPLVGDLFIGTVVCVLRKNH